MCLTSETWCLRLAWGLWSGIRAPPISAREIVDMVGMVNMVDMVNIRVSESVGSWDQRSEAQKD